MALAAAVQGAWMGIPDDLRDNIPRNAVHILTIFILVTGVGGRLIRQDTKKDD